MAFPRIVCQWDSYPEGRCRRGARRRCTKCQRVFCYDHKAGHLRDRAELDLCNGPYEELPRPEPFRRKKFLKDMREDRERSVNDLREKVRKLRGEQ